MRLLWLFVMALIFSDFVVLTLFFRGVSLIFELVVVVLSLGLFCCGVVVVVGIWYCIGLDCMFAIG